MDKIAQISLIVYAVLMSAGGLVGFLKGKSKVSLIMGLLSAAVMGVAYYLSSNDMQSGLVTGIAVTTLLTPVFLMRLLKTKKFMPSGMLLIFTGIEEALLLAGIFIK